MAPFLQGSAAMPAANQLAIGMEGRTEAKAASAPGSLLQSTGPAARTGLFSDLFLGRAAAGEDADQLWQEAFLRQAGSGAGALRGIILPTAENSSAAIAWPALTEEKNVGDGAIGTTLATGRAADLQHAVVAQILTTTGLHSAAQPVSNVQSHPQGSSGAAERVQSRGDRHSAKESSAKQISKATDAVLGQVTVQLPVAAVPPAPAEPPKLPGTETGIGLGPGAGANGNAERSWLSMETDLPPAGSARKAAPVDPPSTAAKGSDPAADRAAPGSATVVASAAGASFSEVAANKEQAILGGSALPPVYPQELSGSASSQVGASTAHGTAAESEASVHYPVATAQAAGERPQTASALLGARPGSQQYAPPAGIRSGVPSSLPENMPAADSGLKASQKVDATSPLNPAASSETESQLLASAAAAQVLPVQKAALRNPGQSSAGQVHAHRNAMQPETASAASVSLAAGSAMDGKEHQAGVHAQAQSVAAAGEPGRQVGESVPSQPVNGATAVLAAPVAAKPGLQLEHSNPAGEGTAMKSEISTADLAPGLQQLHMKAGGSVVEAALGESGQGRIEVSAMRTANGVAATVKVESVVGAGDGGSASGSLTEFGASGATVAGLKEYLAGNQTPVSSIHLERMDSPPVQTGSEAGPRDFAGGYQGGQQSGGGGEETGKLFSPEPQQYARSEVRMDETELTASAPAAGRMVSVMA